MGVCYGNEVAQPFAFTDAIVIQRTKDSQAGQVLARLAPHLEFFLMIAAIVALAGLIILACHWPQGRAGGRMPSLAERRDHGFDRKKQGSTIPRIFDELGAMQIEAPCRIVFGVDEYRADADALRGDRDTAQGVREDIGTQAFACMTAAHREPADDRDGDRVRGVAPKFSRRGRTFHRSSRNAEIGDDTVACADHIGAREAALVFQGALTEPLVKRGLAAIECRKVVFGSQRNGLRQSGSRLVRYLRHAGTRRNSDRSFAPGAGALSSARMKAS